MTDEVNTELSTTEILDKYERMIVEALEGQVDEIRVLRSIIRDLDLLQEPLAKVVFPSVQQAAIDRARNEETT